MFAITDDELRDRLMQASSSPDSANAFFNQFQYVQELFQGHYCEAYEHGVALLHHCQELAPGAYSQIHKGTPFYWIRTAAFLKHDYEIAVFFYDAAMAAPNQPGPVAVVTGPGLT
jgi:hypothetical protein